MRAIKPILAGEELFHSYCDLTSPTPTRTSHLSSTYGFDCDCARCVGETSIDESELTKDQMTARETQTVRDCLNEAAMMGSGEVDDLEKEYTYLMRALTIQRAKLGRYNVERYKTEGLALSVAMCGGGDAVQHARSCVDFLAYVCNEFHPLRLLQVMTLAELLECEEGGAGKEEAQVLFRALVRGAEVSYGSEHEYVARYRELIH